MKYLIRISKPDILLIQETKMQKEAFVQVSGNFWEKGGGLIVKSRGAFGGIGTQWDDHKFDLIESKHFLHWILTKLLHKYSNIQVSPFNVYVPSLYAEKKECWNLLKNERGIGSLDNVIMAYDLNVILSQAKKRGGFVVRDPIREKVDEIILDQDLVDGIPTKCKFTWTNRRMGCGHIATSIDRFFIQDSYLLLGLNYTSKILPFGGSDHKPTLVELR